MIALLVWLAGCTAPDKTPGPGETSAPTADTSSAMDDTPDPCEAVSEPVGRDEASLGFSAEEVAAQFEGLHRAPAFDEAGEPMGEVVAEVVFGDGVLLWSYTAVVEGATCPADRWLEVPVEVRLEAEDGSFSATYASRWEGPELSSVLQAGEYLPLDQVETTRDVSGAREVWVQVLVHVGDGAPAFGGEVQAIVEAAGDMVTERTLLSW